MADAEPTPPPEAASPETMPPRTLPAWAAQPHRADETDGASRVLLVGRLAAALLTVLLVVLLVRVVQLQVDPPVPISERIGSQRSTASIAGRRGALVDRRGRTVAATRVGQRLFVDPALIENRSTFSERVGYGLGYKPVQIEKKLSGRSRSRYVVIDQRLDEERAEKVETMHLRGLATEPILVRDYPYGVLGGHLIGFVGRDGKGLEGIERLFNKRMTPDAGRFRYLRDAQGRPLWVEAESYEENRDGQTVRLSLDMVIQSIAEKRLAEAIEKYGAAYGEMVIMDPHTGEILAMANYPPFNPAEFGSSSAAERRNRCVTDIFEPGSIFKPFVWAAATQQGIAHPKEKIDCTDAGWWKPDRGPGLRDAHAHGVLTWDEVLVNSSNIGMGKVAERMGKEGVYDVVADFGFGKTTGSGLPGEIEGLLRAVKNWSYTDITRVPIGQGVAVTPLQITRAFCSLANGGLLVTPRILAADDDQRQTMAVRVLSQAVADHTREVLHRVVIEGTGRKADSELYALFGKTGTAQVPDLKHGGYSDQYVSSFVAGAPVDEPRLVIGCFIHKPDRKKGHYGGTVAAPTVMKVMEESLLYLGVPPHLSTMQMNDRRVSAAED